MVAVKGHVKGDGTKVRAHNRDAPGAERQLRIAAVIVLAVWALSQGWVRVTGGVPAAPEPSATVTVGAVD